MRRVGGLNAPVGSRGELVANCAYTADATQLDSCVGGVYLAILCDVAVRHERTLGTEYRTEETGRKPTGSRY